ncbi:MAG: hypothetical protein WED08_02140 [Patescibacteria group bacterium]
MESLLFAYAVVDRDHDDDGDDGEGKTTREGKGEHHPFEIDD